MIRRAIGAICGLVSIALAGAGHAESVTIKVGYSAGGAYDTYARLVARHLPHHMDGKPDVIVQNVPGAGSMKLARMLLASEPADGSVIGMFNASIATAPILDANAGDLDVEGFRWIGSLARQPSLCVVSKNSGIATIEDFAAREMFLGSTGKASQTYLFAAAAKDVLGAEYTIVTGFDGGADVSAAMLRGEIQRRCGTSLAAYQSNMDPDLFIPIVQIALDIPEATADIPSLLDLIEDETDQRALRILASSLDMDRPLALPKGTPDDILDTYRAAFSSLVADPAFLAEAAELGLVIDPGTGAEVEALVSEVLASPDPIKNRARDMVD